eukprot:5824139-Lingulodinium_polyedra.AAC.1
MQKCERSQTTQMNMTNMLLRARRAHENDLCAVKTRGVKTANTRRKCGETTPNMHRQCPARALNTL